MPKTGGLAGAIVVAAAAVVIGAAGAASTAVPAIAPGFAYRETHFVSDLPGLSLLQDPPFVSPWGLTRSASSPFWVATNGTSSTQPLTGDHGGTPLVIGSPSLVTIPGGLPTGAVFNTTGTFLVAGSAAELLTASITGNIVAWRSGLGTTGSIMASQPGHLYTGLALANNGSANFLYAADFANGTIDVYNTSYVLQSSASFPFADPTIPTTAGNTYHPYNIQAIGSSLYVAYAKVGVGGLPEPGAGKGYLRRFNANGVRDLTFGTNNGPLDVPWGVVIAPGTFGLYGGDLLVANNGDGTVNAFNSTTGTFLAALHDEADQPIAIDGLRGLSFGNASNGGQAAALYFTAGVAFDEHGLFGKLLPTTATATSLVQFVTDSFLVNEGAGHQDVTLFRDGNASAPATVSLATYDASQVDHASQKSDYTITLADVTFAPGEVTKTVSIPISDDEFDENNEVINLALVNPSGTGVGLGDPNRAVVTIADDDVTPPVDNVIDDPAFFVNQAYVDFLHRAPTAKEAASATKKLAKCKTPAACNAARAGVALARYGSKEFQATTMLPYLTNKVAFGIAPFLTSGIPIYYGQLQRDAQSLLRGAASKATLEPATVAYFASFVQRPDFVAKYPTSLTPQQFVDALGTNGGITPKKTAVNQFGGAADTSDQAARARALRIVATTSQLARQEAAKAFDLFTFFVLDRRDADTSAFNSRLNQLNTAGSLKKGEAALMDAIVQSSEYRQRFGPT